MRAQHGRAGSPPRSGRSRREPDPARRPSAGRRRARRRPPAAVLDQQLRGSPRSCTAPPPRARTPSCSAARGRPPAPPAPGSAARRADEQVGDRACRPPASTSASVSRNATPSARGERVPTVVLPDAGRTDEDERAGRLIGSAARRGSPAALRRVSATESPPNFSSDGVGEHQRDHRLHDDAAARHRAGVAALVDRDGGLAGRDVDRGERPRHGRDGLHRGAHPQHLAVGHAALDAAGAVGAPDGTAPSGRRSISSWATEPRRRGGLQAVADLDRP